MGSESIGDRALDQWKSQSVVDRNRVNGCVSIFSSDMQIVNGVEYWSFAGWVKNWREL
jgi:hypothetical protein